MIDLYFHAPSGMVRFKGYTLPEQRKTFGHYNAKVEMKRNNFSA